MPTPSRTVPGEDRTVDRRRPSRAVTTTLAADPLGGTVRRTVLPNGLRILTEAIPAMRSVSFGVWVGVGSRDEAPASRRRLALPGAPAVQGHQAAHRAGHLGQHRGGRRRDERVHHEGIHLLLRAGARRRRAAGRRRDVRPGRRLGARADADVETERGVILEEIAMHDDEPGDEVHDLFAEAIYGADTPLGRLISGTAETDHADDPRPDPVASTGRRTSPPNMVVAAAGNLDHDAGRRAGRAAFDRVGFGDAGAAAAVGAPRRRRRPAPVREPTVVRPREGHRAGAPRARLRRRSAASTSAASRSACSTTASAAACRQPAVPGDPGEARPRLLGLLVHLAVRRLRAVRGLRRLRAGQGRRGARADPRRAGARSPRTA